MNVTCPYCQQAANADVNYSGQCFTCGRCDGEFIVNLPPTRSDHLEPEKCSLCNSPASNYHYLCDSCRMMMD